MKTVFSMRMMAGRIQSYVQGWSNQDVGCGVPKPKPPNETSHHQETHECELHYSAANAALLCCSCCSGVAESSRLHTADSSRSAEQTQLLLLLLRARRPAPLLLVLGCAGEAESRERTSRLLPSSTLPFPPSCNSKLLARLLIERSGDFVIC